MWAFGWTLSVHVGKDYRKVSTVSTRLLNKLVTRQNVPSWVGFVVYHWKDYRKVGTSIHTTILQVGVKTEWVLLCTLEGLQKGWYPQDSYKSW